jgi:hypothetical protein
VQACSACSEYLGSLFVLFYRISSEISTPKKTWPLAGASCSYLQTHIKLKRSTALYPLDFINHRAPKTVVFGIQLKSFQSHALQSSSRFSARREASGFWICKAN